MRLRVANRPAETNFDDSDVLLNALGKTAEYLTIQCNVGDNSSKTLAMGDVVRGPMFMHEFEGVQHRGSARPALSEAIKEAALAVDRRALNL